MRVLLDTHIALWAVADTKLIRPNDAPKHNDPFDRMLLAQAKYEGLKLITHDSLIPYYGESCVISV